MIPEYARELLITPPELQNRPEFQQMQLQEQLRREAATEACDDSLKVCDRGILDIICYSRFFRHPCDAHALMAQMSYDHVFLLSPFDMDVRSRFSMQQQKMRLELHQCFKVLLSENEIKYVWPGGTPADRLGTVRHVVCGVLK